MNQTVQNAVYDYRQSMGMTQEDLAEKVSVSRQTIISIEKGHYIPTTLLTLKIANVLNVTAEELFKLDKTDWQ